MAAEVIPLGVRLRSRREELGLTQTQAARELDVARTAYRLWEMEAARPAPDRWRAIADWLGITVTAMLLAAELLSEDEASSSDRTVAGSGLTSTAWDTQSGASAGDFFSQERSMIADQLQRGGISPTQATKLRDVLSRIQDTTATPSRSWHPGWFRKRFPNDDLAPALSRAALTATALGIPDDGFEIARVLVSELVTNSVVHSGSDWVELSIMLDEHRLRIAVTDQTPEPIRPRTPDLDGGWGLTLVAESATRWGVDRERAGKTIWCELDLA